MFFWIGVVFLVYFVSRFVFRGMMTHRTTIVVCLAVLAIVYYEPMTKTDPAQISLSNVDLQSVDNEGAFVMDVSNRSDHSVDMVSIVCHGDSDGVYAEFEESFWNILEEPLAAGTNRRVVIDGGYDATDAVALHAETYASCSVDDAR